MKEIKDLGFGVIQVNETKPTISKMESVDNYRDKWQKLKEWLEEKKRRNERRLKEAPINTEFYIQVSVQGITINKILTIMQELEGEDVKD